jgi:MFS transporter, PCFT/HCP family, solute carrier family 46, member 3
MLTKMPSGCIEQLRAFFDFDHIKETFNVAFKMGEGNRRMRVAMLMIVVCVVIGPMHGE